LDRLALLSSRGTVELFVVRNDRCTAAGAVQLSPDTIARSLREDELLTLGAGELRRHTFAPPVS
jgi:hypothetical protein